MPKDLSINPKILCLNQIDSEDCFFQTSLTWPPIDELAQSIAEYGVLSPLRIQRKTSVKLRIISGFRRYKAAMEAGLEEIPCLIVNENDLLIIFRGALADNLASRPLHLLEKATAIRKLRCNFQLSEKVLLEEYLPLLGIPADRFHLEHYQNLSALPKSLKKAITECLAPETALKISRWTSQEQEFFVGLVAKFRPSKSRQRHLFTLLDEVRALQRSTASAQQDKVSAVTIWKTCGGADIEQKEHYPLADRYAQAVDQLLKLRFPHLSEYQEKYRSLKEKLKLPPQVQLQVPSNFEGNKIRISFSARRTEEFRNLVKKLEEISSSENLRKIFDLL